MLGASAIVCVDSGASRIWLSVLVVGVVLTTKNELAISRTRRIVMVDLDLIIITQCSMGR